MENQIFEDIVVYYGDEFDDTLSGQLRVCVRRAISSFKNKRNYPSGYSEETIEKDMQKFYSCIFDLAVFWFTKMGQEFQDTHSENSTNMSWQSENEVYAIHNVIPIGRVY